MLRGLVALAVALAVATGAALGAPSSAGADPASYAGTSPHAVKRSKAKRCGQQRRTAKRAARSGRARKLGCGSGRARGRKPPRPALQGTAAPAPSVSGAPAAPGGGLAPTVPATAPSVPVVSTLGVSAYDMDGFLLRLTRTSVPAGNLTIFFRNHDVSEHNLWIASPNDVVVEQISDSVGEGGGASRTVAVTAGSWRLFCSLRDHGAMTRTLTVAA